MESRTADFSPPTEVTSPQEILELDYVYETITPAENADRVLAALERMGANLDGNQETHARGDTDDQER